ncbi:hypothetical protein BH10ACI3_BH10ACI3_23830 [soil metagenome]
MVRIVLGVIAGFIVWSIFWVGTDKILIMAFPDWYGKYSNAVEDALVKGMALSAEPLIYVAALLRSFVTSLAAGYIAALVAGEYKRSTMILGVILVLVGLAVEYMMWNVAPVWYHVLFVLFLVPMTILGGRLRRPS